MPNQWGLMLDGKGMAEINSLISVSQIGRKISLTRGTPPHPRADIEYNQCVNWRSFKWLLLAVFVAE